MTEHDQQHIDRICKTTENDLRRKYEKGQAEHGGSLTQKPCLKFAIDEVTDLVTYLHTAQEQLARAIEGLDTILSPESDCYTLENVLTRLTRIRNILKYGNKEGKVYDS